MKRPACARAGGVLSALAWTLAAAWVYKAVSAARGLRQIPDILSLPGGDRPGAQEPRVAVIVPACNEEADIRQSIEAGLRQPARRSGR